MIKSLIKDTATEKLNEAISKYIPMVLEDNSAKTINKTRDRVLRESRVKVLSGDKANNRDAINVLENEANELGIDLDAEIAKITGIAKF
jgi:GTP cyclohydrolase I